MPAATSEENPQEIAPATAASRWRDTPGTGRGGQPSGPRHRSVLVLAIAALTACGDDGPTEPSTLNLTVDRAYLVQAVQRPDGSVPLVAGREATVRVFPVANELNTAAPAVRVRLLEDGVPFDSVEIAAPATGVPTSVDEASLAGSWNATIPGDMVRPGLSIQAVVDPDGAVPEASAMDNVFPATGALALTVEEAPPLRVRFVSVVNGAESGFVDGDRIADYMALTEKIFPAATFEVDIRIGGVISSVDDVSSAPGTVLQEVRQLQQTEDPNRIYVGVVSDAAWPGGSGLALVGGWAAIIREGTAASRRVVFPHQMGHLMGRLHAPACDATADTDFPYADDAVGQLGYDDGAVIPADTQDIMSICPLNDPWVSDYTWEAMLTAALERGGA